MLSMLLTFSLSCLLQTQTQLPLTTEHLLPAQGPLGTFFQTVKIIFLSDTRPRCETFNRDGLIIPSPLRKVKCDFTAVVSLLCLKVVF